MWFTLCRNVSHKRTEREDVDVVAELAAGVEDGVVDDGPEADDDVANHEEEHLHAATVLEGRGGDNFGHFPSGGQDGGGGCRTSAFETRR